MPTAEPVPTTIHITSLYITNSFKMLQQLTPPITINTVIIRPICTVTSDNISSLCDFIRKSTSIQALIFIGCNAEVVYHVIYAIRYSKSIRSIIVNSTERDCDQGMIFDVVNLLISSKECSITCIRGLEVRTESQFQSLVDTLLTNTSLYELELIVSDGLLNKGVSSNVRQLTMRTLDNSTRLAHTTCAKQDFNWIRATVLIASMRANTGHPLLNSLLACTDIVTKQLGYVQSLKRKRTE